MEFTTQYCHELSISISKTANLPSDIVERSAGRGRRRTSGTLHWLGVVGTETGHVRRCVQDTMLGHPFSQYSGRESQHVVEQIRQGTWLGTSDGRCLLSLPLHVSLANPTFSAETLCNMIPPLSTHPRYSSVPFWERRVMGFNMCLAKIEVGIAYVREQKKTIESHSSYAVAFFFLFSQLFAHEIRPFGPPWGR